MENLLQHLCRLRKACNKMFHHCLTQAAAGKGQQHLRMAQIAADCAEFCELSSKLLGRSSTLAMVSCTACADACNRCAQECDSFDTDLEMKMCSQECHRCEDSCRKMVKGGASGEPRNEPTGPENQSPASDPGHAIGGPVGRG